MMETLINFLTKKPNWVKSIRVEISNEVNEGAPFWLDKAPNNYQPYIKIHPNDYPKIKDLINE